MEDGGISPSNLFWVPFPLGSPLVSRLALWLHPHQHFHQRHCLLGFLIYLEFQVHVWSQPLQVKLALSLSPLLREHFPLYCQPPFSQSGRSGEKKNRECDTERKGSISYFSATRCPAKQKLDACIRIGGLNSCIGTSSLLLPDGPWGEAEEGWEGWGVAPGDRTIEPKDCQTWCLR